MKNLRKKTRKFGISNTEEDDNKEMPCAITKLRKVGGSIMLVVPPAVLKILNLRPGAKMSLAVRHGRLVMEPQPRLRYSLDELLQQCNPKVRRKKEERQWLSDKSAGGELI